MATKLNWRKQVWDDKFRTPVYCYTARACDSFDFNINPVVWTDGTIEHWECDTDGDIDDCNFPVQAVDSELAEKLMIPYKNVDDLKAICQKYWDVYRENVNKGIQAEAKRLHAKANELAKRKLK